MHREKLTYGEEDDFLIMDDQEELGHDRLLGEIACQ
jgi:hypothetical protein